MKKWNYLEGIANEICPNTDISMGLLIGANCAEALEPKEVISSRESGPCPHKKVSQDLTKKKQDLTKICIILMILTEI